MNSMKINKILNLKEKELKKLEQDLFLDEIKLEEAYKNGIEKIKEKEKFDINFERLFILDVY